MVDKIPDAIDHVKSCQKCAERLLEMISYNHVVFSDYRDVACSKCGAGVGFWCRAKNSTITNIHSQHMARRIAYKEK